MSNKYLSDKQLDRYSRQIIMPEISEIGQTRLLSSKILIVGCGGLGCPVALYLAAAGVGSITLIDDEKIEVSNLNRQIAFKSTDIGKSKSQTLEIVIKDINPEIQVFSKKERLNETNILNLFSKMDLIIDCTDNYHTRCLISKYCINFSIPMSFGAAVRQEGQTAFFRAGCIDSKSSNLLKNYPCYNCIFPNKPDSNLIPRCSEVGILGPITGVISSIQSLNVLRYLTKQKVSENLILWDGISFYEIKLEKNLKCKICGNL